VFAHPPTTVTDDGTRAVTVIPGEPAVSLNRTAGFRPSSDGSLPYFHLDGPLAPALDRVVAAGVAVVEPVGPRGDLGLFALVTDSGSRGGVQSSASIPLVTGCIRRLRLAPAAWDT
jgi:predicted enzyme related to lactoylglutathione lyase